ncbi:hypothetical protein FVE85_5595 [Porphyridium purpureum]|uniref:Uncharacterized protein n=1 Tax=Porphyridium purpureum TaxID=35688 RepID=A0A5J4Z404_PORPP|nr:hypothetical protein FVE85_5595 [Porphyridium purpureum]|eukprot:POR4332..scf295_1
MSGPARRAPSGAQKIGIEQSIPGVRMPPKSPPSAGVAGLASPTARRNPRGLAPSGASASSLSAAASAKRPPSAPGTQGVRSPGSSVSAAPPANRSNSAPRQNSQRLSMEYGNIMRAAALPIRLGSESQDLTTIFSEDLSGDQENKKGSLVKFSTAKFSRRSSDFVANFSGSVDSNAGSETDGGASKKGGGLFARSKTSDRPSTASSTNASESAQLAAKSSGPRTERTWDDKVIMAHLKAGLLPRSAEQQVDMRRQPPLQLIPYQKNWARDVFVVPHNAIRRELMDCYMILFAMDVRRDDMTAKDFDMFFQWWKTFALFVIHYLDAEEDVIYPWFEERQKLTGLLAKEKRNKIKEHMRHVLYLVMKSEERLNTPNFNFDPLLLLKRAVDKFCLLTLEYFTLEEKLLPHTIQQHCTEKEKREVEKAYANYLLKGENPGTDLVILTRWLQVSERDPKRLLEWRYDNLGPMSWSNVQYGVWWKAVNAKHLDVPRIFKVRRDVYKTELRQREILRSENPEQYKRKYAKFEQDRARARAFKMQDGTELFSSVTGTERDHEMDKLAISSNSPVSPKSPKSPLSLSKSPNAKSPSSADAANTLLDPSELSSLTSENAFAKKSSVSTTEAQQAQALAAARSMSSSASNARVAGIGRLDSSASMFSSKSFVLSSEGQAELEELVNKAAKLNEYLAVMDRKYGSGLADSYGANGNDDALSLRSEEYSHSYNLGDELSLVDDTGYQYNMPDAVSAYSASLMGDEDSKSILDDIDIDLDNLSLADDSEGFDVGAFDLEQYLEFDAHISASGRR